SRGSRAGSAATGTTADPDYRSTRNVEDTMTETHAATRKENEGTAVEAGSKATERFTASGKLAQLEVPQERVSLLAGEAIKAINDIAVKHQVTYEEYHALKAWLIKVGTDGEWPL